MKKLLIKFMIACMAISSISIVFSGCASSSYSKGFDEAD